MATEPRSSSTPSHDLKTPLFSILGLAGILKEETPPGGPRAAYLDRVLANATRMDAQIRELVTLAKIGTYTPAPEPVDLGAPRPRAPPPPSR
jgi:signal transduction histidine kinase